MSKEEEFEESMTEDEKIEEEVLTNLSKEVEKETSLTHEERVEDEVVKEIQEKIEEKPKPKITIKDDKGQEHKLKTFDEEEDEEIDLTEMRKKVIGFVKDIFKSKDKESEEEETELAEKRKEAIKFVKQKATWFALGILTIIIWFGSYIRTRNLPLLKDITTGKFVPLALDPHVFLRYAQYVVEHGQLFITDMMRFVPVGFQAFKYKPVSGFIVFLYDVIKLVKPSATIEYVDVIYPVIAFAIAMVFFYLLTKRLFDTKVALVSTFFLSVAPAFLYRTMAGFSDHEAIGTMLLFIALYLFFEGWRTESTIKKTIFGLGAGIFTGWMGLTWGGWKFLLLIVAAFTLVELVLERLSIGDKFQYLAWVLGTLVVVSFIYPMYSVKELVTSTSTGLTYIVAILVILKLLIDTFNPFNIKSRLKNKAPLAITLLASVAVLGILFLAATNPSLLSEQAGKVHDMFVKPMGTDRWMLTVAEQHQPYFTDWMGQFGPIKLKIPLFFTMFFLGSILLVYQMCKPLKKHRILVTSAYTLFIIFFIFSRYSPNSKLNGTNTLSLFLYLGSFIIFTLFVVLGFLHSFYKNKTRYESVRTLNKKYVFIIVWFIIMVVAARGAIRLFYVFTPIVTILAGYFVVEGTKLILRFKEKLYKILLALIMAYFVLTTAYAYSTSSLGQAKYTGPSYNHQWQIAGKWIRENTPLDAVFGHWWDYGYWVQTGGERATFVDGANSNRWWNHLNGRHVLTGQTQEEAMKMLKAHNVTHYLIISDEIGKYTAYSSIGSDADYDRYSWITTFTLNPQQTQETRDTVTYVYQGGYTLDDDFTYKDKVYPKLAAGIGAILLPIKTTELGQGNETKKIQQIAQPEVILVYQGQQERVPLECVYLNGNMYKFPIEEGLKGCFRIIPTLNGNGQLDNAIGAGLYVSYEGVKALWTNLFLFEQNNPDYDTSAFNLIYNDEDKFPLSLYSGRLIGPLKIWEVNYPANFSITQEEYKYYTGPNDMLPDYFYDV